jgi:hypothetical protein
MPEMPLLMLNSPILDPLARRPRVDRSVAPAVYAWSNRPWLRWVLVGCGEVIGIALVIAAFWYQDWRYSLPTPRPPHIDQPEIGARIVLPEATNHILRPSSKRPVLLHFFNPDCPCSRFNLEHVRQLRQQFGDRVDFVAVLEGTDPDRLLNQFQQLDWPVPAIFDTDLSLATTTGVYATPQAVILDSDQRLFYRGNYNTSRYCTSPQTEFARLALQSLLKESESPAPMSLSATRAYGCSLPTCTMTGVAR